MTSATSVCRTSIVSRHFGRRALDHLGPLPQDDLIYVAQPLCSHAIADGVTSLAACNENGLAFNCLVRELHLICVELYLGRGVLHVESSTKDLELLC